MKVQDLDRNQLRQLKVNYLAEKNDDSISYGEIAEIDDLVSDNEIFEAYHNTVFSEDDF